jgi:hypothetical protein
MAFEPLGYGNRWYDRVVGRRLKSIEFIGVLIVAGMFIFVLNV